MNYCYCPACGIELIPVAGCDGQGILITKFFCSNCERYPVIHHPDCADDSVYGMSQQAVNRLLGTEVE